MHSTVAVVVVCHKGYIHFAEQCIATIETQSLSFVCKVLVYDGEEVDLHCLAMWRYGGWKARVGCFGNPNRARNYGLIGASDCEWVVFWDADNLMPHDYLARAYGHLCSVPQNVGVCYPDCHAVDKQGNLLVRHIMPEWNLGAAQARNLCDSGSFWRVEAVCEVGGFDPAQVRHDDFTLALRIFRAGWKGQKIPATINLLHHGKNRSRHADITQSLWIAYHFGFVTIWGGGATHAMEWYQDAEFPPCSHLYWIDNSGGQMWEYLQDSATALRDKFQSITIIQGGEPHRTEKGDIYKNPARHKHVAYLYNTAFSSIREEIIVTIEDDMIPPVDGARGLLSNFCPGSNVAVAAGVYRSRTSPAHLCCSKDKTKWRDVPKFDHLPPGPFEVGMTGGGFAMFGNWALRECLPMHCELTPDGRLMGWDANLGMCLTSKGFKLLVDPNVKCRHCCSQVEDWERCNPKPICENDPYGY